MEPWTLAGITELCLNASNACKKDLSETDLKVSNNATPRYEEISNLLV